MATKKWLNIVVDGNSALGPYWRKIVSDYLQKIVRFFFGHSREEGVNPSCAVGLIIYNSNSSLGRNIQYINWTKDVENFLSILPYLSFTGDNLKQHTIVEGLAEALVMFPKERMTETEYFECERHCILVAMGEPVAKRMLVSLPMVQEGKFISGQLIALNANFLDVAKMFVPLRVSLSVITPKQHPLFISIFNLGNCLKEDAPITDYGNNKLTVLLSRNFKEAHYAHYNKGIVGSDSKASVEAESMNTITDATLPITFTNNCQENLFSANSSMIIGQQSNEGVQNVRHESTSTVAPVIPHATTSEEESLTHLLQQEQPISLDEILGQVLRSSTSIAGEGSLPQNNPEGSNAWYPPGAGAFSFGFPNTIEKSLNQFQSSSFPVHPYGSAGAGAGPGPSASAGVSVEVDASTDAGANASACPYYGSHHQQFPRHHWFEMSENNPAAMRANTWASPAPMMPQYNQAPFWPKPPTDFKDFVQAWEGWVVGRIQSHCVSLNQAKAFRRLTSPVTLTDQWSNRLDIALFLPKKVVSYTMRIYGGPIDHVFFQVTQFNNLDLYEHLKSNNLCAKIVLPFQTIILSTTDIMHQYLGSVFPGDTVFFEPL